MKLVFLDANVLFSAAYREKSGLLRLWNLPGVKLITSPYSAREAIVNLAEDAQRQRLESLMLDVTVETSAALPPLPDGVRLPPKDQPILQAAMSAQANVLLTGDTTHFGAYYGKSIGGVKVMTPASFVREMES